MSTELPAVADTKPAVMELEPGTYWWCSCGLSTKQPFCNGAHKGTDFKPLAVAIEQTESVALCLCKRTAHPPFCDGSHHQLEG